MKITRCTWNNQWLASYRLKDGTRLVASAASPSQAISALCQLIITAMGAQR